MSAETIPAYYDPDTGETTYMPPGATAMTVGEYHIFNRKSEARYEYVSGYAVPKDGAEKLEDGTFRAIVGDSPQHNRIAGNIYFHLDRAFGQRDCEIYFEKIQTRVSEAQYRYPDIVALCGVAQFDSQNPPCLLNPSVVVEVLSLDWELVNCGVTFSEYTQAATLTDFVFVDSNQMFVGHYIRQSASTWDTKFYESPADVLTFASLDVSLTLADIYRKIVFAPAS